MTKKIVAASVLALLVVFGINFAAKAETNTTSDTIKALEEKAANAEKKAAELQMKLDKGMSVKVKSVDDLDSENALPNINTPHKSGPALVVGPKGKATAWMTLTAVAQPSYVAVPTSPYFTWVLEGDVWGMRVKVNVMDTTKLVPEKATFKAGDRVAVHGTMKDGVITATRVRNHSAADDKSAEISAKIQKLIEQVKELCNKITPKPAFCATL